MTTPASQAPPAASRTLPSRTTTRLLGVTAAAVALLLAGCGSEPAAGSGTEINASTAPLTASTADADPTGTGTDTPDADPPGTGTGTDTDTEAPDTEHAGAIGDVLVNLPLEVSAADYPGVPVPSSAEVADADELGAVYAAVGGIDDVVAAVEAAAPASGERLFAYIVSACVVEDVSLLLRGDELTMVVKGNAGLRCQPPPLHLVVWAVGADEVPVDVVPVQAVQK